MQSSSRKTLLTAAAVATLVTIGSASDAFAIRNRYTNQQAQGFGAYFFGDYAQPYGYGESDDGDGGGSYYRRGYDRPIRPYRGRRPIYGYDE